MSLVRKFNAEGAILSGAIGAAYAFSNLTFAVYAKQNNDGTEWLFSYGPAASNYITMGIESDNFLLYKGSGSMGPGSLPTGWALYVATKASGLTKPLFYVYDFAKSEWVADGVAGGADMSDGPGSGPSRVQLGVWNGPGSEQFNGWMAAAAVWERVLSKAEVHELVTLGSVADWSALEADGRWRMDEVLPKDLSGNGADIITMANTEQVEQTIPLPYGEGGEEEEPPEGGAIQVKSGGSLVTAKRWVKSGGILVPA